MPDTPQPSRSRRTQRSATRRGRSPAVPGEQAAAKGKNPPKAAARSKTTKRARPRSASARCILPACCIRDAAVALHAELSALLPASEPVVVDATALEQIDAAGLQLLAAFVASRTQDGGEVRWQHPEGVLADAAGVLGLQGLLSLTDARG